jgi:hypothetical protein
VAGPTKQPIKTYFGSKASYPFNKTIKDMTFKQKADVRESLAKKWKTKLTSPKSLSIANKAVTVAKTVPGPLRNVIKGVELVRQVGQVINRTRNIKQSMVKYDKNYVVPPKFRKMLEGTTKPSLKPLPKWSKSSAVFRSELKERTSINAAGKTKVISKNELRARNKNIKNIDKIKVKEENIVPAKYQPKENRAAIDKPATYARDTKFHDMSAERPLINRVNIKKLRDMLSPVVKKKTVGK